MLGNEVGELAAVLVWIAAFLDASGVFGSGHLPAPTPSICTGRSKTAVRSFDTASSARLTRRRLSSPNLRCHSREGGNPVSRGIAGITRSPGQGFDKCSAGRRHLRAGNAANRFHFTGPRFQRTICRTRCIKCWRRAGDDPSLVHGTLPQARNPSARAALIDRFSARLRQWANYMPAGLETHAERNLGAES